VSVTVEFHPHFWKDVEGQAVYLQKEAELGEAFLDAVEVAIETVRQAPLQRSLLYGSTRHILLTRFRRHVIHYEFFEVEQRVRIYGLFHGAEDPGKWHRRLE